MANIQERISKLLDNPTLPTSTQLFLESLRNYHGAKGCLTEAQANAFASIEKNNRPEELEKKKKWVTQYDDEKRNIARICAQYYAPGAYFTDLARCILGNPEFVPTEKQYNAMCCNKYAKKVIENTFSEPKYAVGTFVALRASSRGNWDLKQFCKGKPLMVIDNDCGPIISAAKGAKRYRILPIGSSQHFDVEERDLKLCKKLK